MMYIPTHEEIRQWETLIAAITKAVPHLEDALSILRQPSETDDTIVLDDLINRLLEKRSRLESWLLGIEEE